MRPAIVGPNVFSWSEPIHIRNQFGLCQKNISVERRKREFLNGSFLREDGMRTWRHVDSAAPRPVPVQTRIPRLYKYDVFETPANWNREQIHNG